MDNAIPIPFLCDPDRPELSYQLGFSLSPSVKQRLDEYEPSIVHITVPDCTSLHIIQYARQKELPIMGTYHSNIPEYMEHYPGLSWLKHIIGGFFRHQYNFIQSLYVPTPFIMRHLIDKYKMDRVTSLKVWGRGVDVEKFNPAYRSMKYRRSLGIADDATVVLWVGRLVPEKRPDIFAKVVRRLHGRGLNFHALVVGAGPCEPLVKNLPNTTFAGWLNAEQLSTAYASADVFLFPSAVETFGNVTLEAAASGLPVVVESGCSGHLVHDGMNGYTAVAGDEEAFFEGTLALVEDEAMRRDFSCNSREMALSLEKTLVVQQMLQNYDRVSEEFYTEYSGRHMNRDSVYTQPDSFNAGKYPRPMVFMFFEWIFVMLFQLVFKIGAIMTWAQKRVAPKKTIVLKKDKRLVPKPPVSAPSKRVKAKQDEIDFSNKSKLSVVEMDDVEIGPNDRLATTSDDTTETTGASSENSTVVDTSNQSFGDCRLSHTLANGFVSAVYFQCKLESHARTFVASCGKITPTFVGGPKRKHSSMEAGSYDVESDSDEPSLDGKIMRRTQLNI
jgi:phosphatidylinositol alpha 1,6-mannosyltransferase